jgi:nitrate reductase gamma subunit
MHAFYDFVVGPLLWISVLVFLGGSAYKVWSWFRRSKKDPFVRKYWSWEHVLKSWRHWLTPFGTMRWRTKPVLTVVSFVFHVCLFLVPIFLTAHLMMLDMYLGVSWAGLPDTLADVLTVVVIAACGFFIWRRITDKQVAFVTRFDDWLVIGVVLATFLTGFLASMQWGPYTLMVSLHFLAGEAFLVMIPFTRAAHMLVWPMTRGYIASEFGAVRKVRDW